MSVMKLPSICGKCGIVAAQTTVVDSQYSIGMAHLKSVLISRWKVYVFTNYEVAVCYNCKERMNQLAQAFKIANVVGLALIITTVAGVFGGDLSTIVVIGLILVGLLTLLRILYKPNLGSFDGHYFKFRNRDYHKEFAKLNPTLVKPATVR